MTFDPAIAPWKIQLYDTDGTLRFEALLVNVTRWPDGNWDAADTVFGIATTAGTISEVRIIDQDNATVWSVTDEKMFYPGVEVKFDMPAAGFPDRRAAI